MKAILILKQVFSLIEVCIIYHYKFFYSVRVHDFLKKKHVYMLHLYMLHLYILYAKFFTRGIWELDESGTIPHVDSSLISSCVNVLI